MRNAKVIIAVVVLAIAAGLFGGYRIWGTGDREKGDIQQLLRNIEGEVARIQEKNKELVASIESSKGEIEAAQAARKENQELKDRQQALLKEKQGLASSLAEMKAKEIDAKKQAEVEQELRKAQEELKNRIAALESGNRDLTGRLKQAESSRAEIEGQLAEARKELADTRDKASRGDEFKQLSQELNARISELQKENQELRSVIDNISEMTRRKQESQ